MIVKSFIKIQDYVFTNREWHSIEIFDYTRTKFIYYKWNKQNNSNYIISKNNSNNLIVLFNLWQD